MLVLMSWVSPLLGVLGVPVALCVGLSRMVFALHYPSDVIVGAVIGLLTTLGVVWAAQESGLVEWIVRMSPIT